MATRCSSAPWVRAANSPGSSVSQTMGFNLLGRPSPPWLRCLIGCPSLSGRTEPPLKKGSCWHHGEHMTQVRIHFEDVVLLLQHLFKRIAPSQVTLRFRSTSNPQCSGCTSHIPTHSEREACKPIPLKTKQNTTRTKRMRVLKRSSSARKI